MSERQLAGGDLRKVEQIINDTEQVFRRRTDGREQVSLLIIRR